MPALSTNTSRPKLKKAKSKINRVTQTTSAPSSDCGTGPRYLNAQLISFINPWRLVYRMCWGTARAAAGKESVEGHLELVPLWSPPLALNL